MPSVLPFATVQQLAASWRPLTPAEQEKAGTLLAAASRKIRARARDIDDRITAGTLDPDLVADVVCAMVKRAMLAPDDREPVSQMQQSAGPFSQGLTFANPSGDLFLTKAERADLGIGGQVAFTPSMTPDPPPVDPLWWVP